MNPFSRLIGAAALALLAACGGAWGQIVDVPIGGGGGPGSQVLPSAGTVGDLVVVGPLTQGVQDASAYTAPAVVPKGLQFTNSIVYSGAGSINQQWLSVNGLSLTGTATQLASDAILAPFHIYVGGDSVDTTTNGNGNLNVFYVGHATSAGSTGGRTVIQGAENIVGTPTTLSAAGYVAVGGITRVSANLGGTTGAYANYKGTAFGGGFDIYTTSGATFVSLVNSQENDVTLAGGTSAAEKHGLTVVLGSNDAVRAVYDDNGIQFGAQDNASAVGWKTGIMFGAYAHQWAFATDSTLIGAQVRTAGTASPSVALNGVDFSAVTFQSGGCSFKSTGYCVDPSGNVSGLTVVGTNVVGITTNNGAFELRNGNTAITSPATLTLQLGFTDTTAASAQTFQVQNVAAGNSNVAGANWTLIGSRSTGSGASGDIVLQTGGSGAGATVQNSAVTALTIKGVTQAVITAGTLTVGTVSSATGLFVCETAGLLSSGITTCVASDRSVKHDIEPIEDDVLDKVLANRGVRFSYNDGYGAPGRRIGVIANDWELAFPELVDMDSHGIRHFDYAATWGLTVEIFRRQQIEINSIKRRLN
jgi:hypothetical protein